MFFFFCYWLAIARFRCCSTFPLAEDKKMNETEEILLFKIWCARGEYTRMLANNFNKHFTSTKVNIYDMTVDTH